MTHRAEAAGARSLKLRVLAGSLSIARLAPDAGMPDWLPDTGWWAVTRTDEELSIVCESRFVPDGIRQNRHWRALQVEGPLDFSLVGILNRITAPMAAAGISLFAVSTFDTDYVLVREPDLQGAIACLTESGIIVQTSD